LLFSSHLIINLYIILTAWYLSLHYNEVCSEESMKEDTIEQDKIEKTDINIAVEKDIKESFIVPFKIETIDSKILELNDAAFDRPLKRSKI
jgi:hypothetical protein